MTASPGAVAPAGHGGPSQPVSLPRKRRGAELVLLLLALVAGIGAYAIVDLAQYGELGDALWQYAAGLTLIVAITHVVIRLIAPYADPILLPTVVLLNGFGLAIIHRLDLADIEDARRAGEPKPNTDAPQQMIWMALGVALFVLVLLVARDHRKLQKVTYTSGLAGIILLALPLVPGLGVTFSGAQIWIRLAGFSFQPAEVAKFCLLVFFAGYLVVKKEALALAGRRFLGLDLPRGRDLGPILLAWLISLGILVFEQDLGTSLLFFGAFVLLLYVATERPGWLVIGAGLFAGGAYFGYLNFAHVRNRVFAWLDPFGHPDGAYQIIQSLYGLAYGGVLGTGLGEGRPDLIPLAKSDFIAAALGEELGLTGLMALILLYGLLVERGLRTALICRDPFGKLVATGFAAFLGIQVFVVLGGVTKLIPLTGLTTPFMSAGGSSLVANWALVALLLRVSDRARRPYPAGEILTDDARTRVVMRR